VEENSVRRFVTARWESLAAAPGGGAALSFTDAWFDMHTCKATIVRKTSVPLKPLASGIFYGYREACKECPGGERVMFIGPNPQHIAAAGVGGEATTVLGTLTRVSLPVRKGGGGSIVVRYAAGVLTDWLSGLGQERVLPEGDVVAGIDIAQGVEDAEPIAIAYASRTIAPLAPGVRPMPHTHIPRPSPPVPPPPRDGVGSKRPVIKIPAPSGASKGSGSTPVVVPAMPPPGVLGIPGFKSIIPLD
jgi:hypothetical protein